MKYKIGDRIKYYRKKRGLSQKQLGDLLGISSNRVSNWEQGTHRPDADILALLCKALNVSADDLLDIQLSTDVLSDTERQLILHYRANTEMQLAVNTLLGLTDT